MMIFMDVETKPNCLGMGLDNDFYVKTAKYMSINFATFISRPNYEDGRVLVPFDITKSTGSLDGRNAKKRSTILFMI